MARIFITGSADGLGALAAKALIADRHSVVLHARNKQRGDDALRQIPGAETVVTADLSDVDAIRQLADKTNALGTFDAVIHNAGVYQVPAQTIFVVNTLAPYILTSLIEKPKRLVYLSSGMHLQGRPNIGHFDVATKRISYSDSKLHVVMLAMAVARLWPDVYANALDPAWVPTNMGGQGAPDDLEEGYETQLWLATSKDKDALVSGRYFYHRKQRRCHVAAADHGLQQQLLRACERLTGITFPRA